MSYFNDELRDVMGSIKNGQSASGLDFFIELKRKINNGYELYSEYNLQLIFSDLTLKNEFSSLLSILKLERIILRSILKNKDKKITVDDLITNIFESNSQLDFGKYIRGGEFYSGAGSVVGRQVKVEKTAGVQRGSSHMAMEDDGDLKFKDILYYIKFIVKILILGFLVYYLVLNRADIYQYVSKKYTNFSSDVEKVVNYVFKKFNEGSDAKSSESEDLEIITEKNDLDVENKNVISNPLNSEIKNSDEVVLCKITKQFGGQYRHILLNKYLTCNVLVDKMNLEDFELNRGNCSVSDNSKRKTTGIYYFGDSINIEIYDYLRNEQRRIMKIFTPNSTESEISEAIKGDENNIFYDVDYDGQTNCNLLEARFLIDSDTYVYKSE